MEIIKELWTSFNDIMFEESSHSYTDSEFTKYTSATTWVQNFVPQVDWDLMAERVARKQGKTKQEIIDLWDYKKNYACDLGTEIHSVMENLWQKKNYTLNNKLVEKYPEIEEDFRNRRILSIDLYGKLKNAYAPVATELIVYDKELKLCGTLDFLGLRLKDNTYTIMDWKTSKKIEKENKFGKIMKQPFADYDNCNFVEYSLQLSLYKYILEKNTSIKINELLVFQIPACGEKLQVVKCIDFSERIKILMEKKAMQN